MRISYRFYCTSSELPEVTSTYNTLRENPFQTSKRNIGSNYTAVLVHENRDLHSIVYNEALFIS